MLTLILVLQHCIPSSDVLNQGGESRIELVLLRSIDVQFEIDHLNAFQGWTLIYNLLNTCLVVADPQIAERLHI